MLKKNDEIYMTVKSCTVQGSGVCDKKTAKRVYYKRGENI